jgi:hypothetical protein
MDKLIEILDLILDKSEKFQDGSCLVPEYVVRRIVRASKAYKKEQKISKRKNKVKIEEIELASFTENSIPKIENE